MTEYFLTMPHDTADEPTMESMQDADPADFEAIIAAVDGFNTALKEAGAFRYAGGLHPPSTAKTVDPTAGEPVVRDEPFVEATQYVGGFWIIEAADTDAAVSWATRIAKVLDSRIEVRAMQ
ncbi:YciI family protein [Actinophytocola sediminis]